MGKIKNKIAKEVNEEFAGKDSEEDSETERSEIRYSILLMCILLIATVGLVYSFLFRGTASLVLLVIFGTIAFITVLTMAGRAYIRTTLACKDEALGLPSGSVRAIIALAACESCNDRVLAFNVRGPC